MVLAEYAERGLCNGRVSVRLSHRSIAAAGGFAAERWRGQHISIDSSGRRVPAVIDICCRRRHSAANAASVMLRLLRAA